MITLNRLDEIEIAHSHTSSKGYLPHDEMDEIIQLARLGVWARSIGIGAIKSIASIHLSEMKIRHFDLPEEVLWTDTKLAREALDCLKRFENRKKERKENGIR